MFGIRNVAAIAIACLGTVSVAQADSVISFGPGANQASESGLGQAGLFNGAATVVNTPDGFAAQFNTSSPIDWIAFENNGQFLGAAGKVSVRTQNQGNFNQEGENIISMDSNQVFEGDWSLLFQQGPSDNQAGHIELTYQSDSLTTVLRSADNSIDIDQIIDIHFVYDDTGVQLFLDNVLVDSSTNTADFTQNTNSVTFGSSNRTNNPGDFGDDLSGLSPGISGRVYGAEFEIATAIPTPTAAAAGLLLITGLVARRRPA
ncbi:MAG: hypothetical protein AAF842_11255 [Planctomycetota bacterium]